MGECCIVQTEQNVNMVAIDFNTGKRTRAYKFYLTILIAKIQISDKLNDREERVLNISIQTTCRVNHYRCRPHKRRFLFGIFPSLLFAIGSSNAHFGMQRGMTSKVPRDSLNTLSYTIMRFSLTKKFKIMC